MVKIESLTSKRNWWKQLLFDDSETGKGTVVGVFSFQIKTELTLPLGKYANLFRAKVYLRA